MRKLLPLLMLVCAVALTGCASATGTTKLNIDARHAYSAPSGTVDNAPTVFLRNVIDGRVFSEGTGSPADPTPDIKSAAQRDITIGRKRNGFGKALGSIELQGGKTVTGIMRSVIEDALADSGYKVLHDEASIDKNSLILNAAVTKFWSWSKWGFWQGYLVTDVAAQIKVPDGNSIPIEVTEEYGVQFGNEEKATASAHKALGKFRMAATEKFREMKAQLPAQTAKK